LSPRAFLGIAAYGLTFALLLKAARSDGALDESRGSFFFAIFVFLAILGIRAYYFPERPIQENKRGETHAASDVTSATPIRRPRSPWLVLATSSVVAFVPVMLLVRFWGKDAPVPADTAALIVCGWALLALTIGIFLISSPRNRNSRMQTWWLPCLAFFVVGLVVVRLLPDLVAVVLQEAVSTNAGGAIFLLLAPVAAICWRTFRILKSGEQ
jgi:hypothetical protein